MKDKTQNETSPYEANLGLYRVYPVAPFFSGNSCECGSSSAHELRFYWSLLEMAW